MIKQFWIQGLISGMDQATDPSLVARNESPLLKNITLDRAGSWITRKGTSALGDRITASDRVWGLFAYNSTADTHTLMMATNTNLYAYNSSTGLWDNKQSSVWTASKRVDGVNFLNRLYLGCEDGTTGLRYTTGGATTAVTPNIYGSMLAVNKDTLAVGGNSIKPNIIFYSNLPFTDTFYTATGTVASNADVGGANTLTTTTGIFEADITEAMIFNSTKNTMAMITATKVNGTFASTLVQTDTDTSTWDNDTIYVLKTNFKQDGACTGIVSYGENFISWDEDNMYIWDPISKYSRKIPNYGCVNYRTVKVVNGVLIWVNREGVYLWAGQGTPKAISAKVTDDIDLYGIWNLINPSNWGQLAAGVRPNDGLYYLSLGDLQTLTGAPASAITNVELVFDIDTGSWILNSGIDEPVCYELFINSSGEKDLYFGCKGTSSVYKQKTGTTDDNGDGTTTAISYEIRTPHHVLGDPKFANKIIRMWVKYKATNDVTVTMSVNRGTYTTFKTLPASSSVITKELKCVPNLWGFSHGLKFTGTGAFQLESYGFEVEFGTTTRLSVI